MFICSELSGVCRSYVVWQLTSCSFDTKYPSFLSIIYRNKTKNRTQNKPHKGAIECVWTLTPNTLMIDLGEKLHNMKWSGIQKKYVYQDQKWEFFRNVFSSLVSVRSVWRGKTTLTCFSAAVKTTCATRSFSTAPTHLYRVSLRSPTAAVAFLRVKLLPCSP